MSFIHMPPKFLSPYSAPIGPSSARPETFFANKFPQSAAPELSSQQQQL